MYNTLFYHASWVKSFSTLSILFVQQVKIINDYKDHVIFQYIEHQLQENILYHYPPFNPCKAGFFEGSF